MPSPATSWNGRRCDDPGPGPTPRAVNAAPVGQRISSAAERRLPALTRKRRPEPLPIRLDRRRIYVLPTRFGLMFALLLFVMLLGALNYGNNPALLLTCLLGAAAGGSIFAGFRAMSGLRLVAMRANPAHAGEPLRLRLAFDAAGRDRQALCIRRGDDETAFSLLRGEPGEALFAITETRRGWLRPGPLRLSTTYPLGLFQLWSWAHPDAAFLVWPALETPTPPFPAGHGSEGALARHGAEGEPADLREYRSTDPPRLIAWKASARHDTLLVREPEREAGEILVFDHARLSGLDAEARISRLAAWVAAADAGRRTYLLRLPGEEFGPGSGAAQQADCMKALALLPGPGRA
ncbi:MAG: DUF58 domain-containing protein [Xanthomonadales bacterium]|nr:DUF58 domain-containing protein [Xanthomonadales bacterium]